jgi:hypothetical protein
MSSPADFEREFCYYQDQINALLVPQPAAAVSSFALSLSSRTLQPVVTFPPSSSKVKIVGGDFGPVCVARGAASICQEGSVLRLTSSVKDSFSRFLCSFGIGFSSRFSSGFGVGGFGFGVGAWGSGLGRSWYVSGAFSSEGF